LRKLLESLFHYISFLVYLCVISFKTKNTVGFNPRAWGVHWKCRQQKSYLRSWC